MFTKFFENYGEPNLLGFNLKELEVDEAFLRIVSNVGSNFSIFQKSSMCDGCPYKKVGEIEEGQNITKVYDTNSYWNFLFNDTTTDDYIHLSALGSERCLVKDISMGEFGVYQMNLNEESCDVETIKEPVFIYGGLIMGILFYFLVTILWAMVQSLLKSYKSKTIPNQKVNIHQLEKNMHISIPRQAIVPVKVENEKKVRLKSLDVFRGLTIILMILVNSGGGKYWIFMHATWNGLTPADVVFPWFLWIMGVCIPMGLHSQQKKSVPKLKIFRRIVERSIKLFVIGIILNSIGGHNQLEKFRIAGVLQRFAISYFFTSCVMLSLGPKPGRKPMKGYFAPFDDIVSLLPQWIIYILIVVGHTLFIFYMPIPGCPTGYIGPGGMSLFQDGKPSPDCVGGVTRFVDLWVLGNSHMLQHPTPDHIYETASLEPEGILGLLPTLFQVFLGIQAGQILMTFKDHSGRCKRWFAWGGALLLIGLFMSSGTMIEGPIPVNKNIWSLSFVLVTSGLAFILLALCYFLIDYKKYLKGSPFYQTGMNSIFLYVAHFFTYNVFPWRYRYGDMKTHLALFIEAMWGTTLWVIVALYLHRKSKFYTV